MSERRRAEIEEKRAKLELLRQARLKRKQDDAERRSNSSTPGISTPYEGGRDDEKSKINTLVTTLLGERAGRRGDTTPGSSVPSTPGPAHMGLGLMGTGMNQNGTRSGSRLSDSGSDKVARNNTMVQAGGEAPERCVQYENPSFILTRI